VRPNGSRCNIFALRRPPAEAVMAERLSVRRFGHVVAPEAQQLL
jgi:hypothetical protein